MSNYPPGVTGREPEIRQQEIEADIEVRSFVLKAILQPTMDIGLDAIRALSSAVHEKDRDDPLVEMLDMASDQIRDGVKAVLDALGVPEDER